MSKVVTDYKHTSHFCKCKAISSSDVTANKRSECERRFSRMAEYMDVGRGKELKPKE